MPHGWVWLNTYYGRTPHIMISPVHHKNMSRDTALCPQHNAALAGVVPENIWPPDYKCRGEQ
jgi:hypothetical protein